MAFLDASSQIGHRESALRIAPRSPHANGARQSIPDRESENCVVPSHKQPEKHVLEAALECMPQAMILTDATLNPVILNARARKHLATSPSLRLANGRLWLPARNCVLDMRYLLRTVTANNRRSQTESAISVTLPSIAGQKPFRIALRALGAGQQICTLQVCTHILVVLYPSSDQRTLCTSSIRLLLGLTPAETCVLEALYSGYKMTDAASRLNITRETVKKHLSSIFRKVGVSSQAQLLQFVSTGPFFI